MKKYLLEDLLQEISLKTTKNNEYEVLTSSQSGILRQRDYFKKQVASQDNTGYKIIKKGQFTYRAMSDTGLFYINRLDDIDIGIISPAYPVFEIKSNYINSDFLKLYFQSDEFQNQISSLSTGSTRLALKYSRLKKLTITIPSIEVQEKIVNELEILKRLISKSEELLDLCDVLIKSKFNELFENAKREKLDDVCKSFKIGPFGSALHKNEISSSGYAFVLSTDNAVTNHFQIKELRFISKEKYQSLIKYKVEKDDLILTMMGTICKSAIVPENIGNAIISSHLCIIKTNENKILPKFLNYAMYLDDEVEHQINLNFVGAIMRGLNLKIVKNLTIKCPCIVKQENFLNIVKTIDELKESYINRKKHYKELLDKKMNEYFN